MPKLADANPKSGETDTSIAPIPNRKKFAPIRSIFRPSMFWSPDLHAESAWVEHIPFVFWLIDEFRPMTIVELGTHTGVSYSAMCQARKTLALSSRCFAIDTWKGDEHAGFYNEGIYRNFINYHDPRYGSFSHIFRSTFDDALRHFEDGSVDLIHIDGLHTYDAVRHDFESWLPKLTPRAIILLHDTNVFDKDFGVHKLWGEVARGRLHFDFFHAYGLGVLALGRNYSRKLQFMFDAYRDERLRSLIREMFAALGHAVRLKFNRTAKIAQLSHELSKLDSDIKSMESRNRKNFAPMSWRLASSPRWTLGSLVSKGRLS